MTMRYNKDYIKVNLKLLKCIKYIQLRQLRRKINYNLKFIKNVLMLKTHKRNKKQQISYS